MKPGTTVINSRNLIVRIATICADGRYRCTIMQPHRAHHKTFSEAALNRLINEQPGNRHHWPAGKR